MTGLGANAWEAVIGRGRQEVGGGGVREGLWSTLTLTPVYERCFSIMLV